MFLPCRTECKVEKRKEKKREQRREKLIKNGGGKREEGGQV